MLYNVGGAEGGFNAPTGRLETIVRFAGLIQNQ
jgi:hypothetical protein